VLSVLAGTVLEQMPPREVQRWSVVASSVCRQWISVARCREILVANIVMMHMHREVALFGAMEASTAILVRSI
jgi:hypothetical protein